MKFLADENFPITAYRVLLKTGYDIKHVAFDMPSIADAGVTLWPLMKNELS